MSRSNQLLYFSQQKQAETKHNKDDKEKYLFATQSTLNTIKIMLTRLEQKPNKIIMRIYLTKMVQTPT